MAKKDAEIIVDEGDVVTLESGTQVVIVPLKSRQFFKMLRIITHGAGGMLLNFKFSADDSPEDFGAKLIALLAFAIPDADDEVFEFLFSMVKPAAEKTGTNLTKTQIADNLNLKESLALELNNPELGDTITLIEAIVKREAEDLQALGKRLLQMFDLAKRTGQVPSEMISE